MIYGYARVSSRSQADGHGLEVQRKELTAAGATEIFEDVYTGTTMDRPAWDALMGRIQSGDTLVVAKLDRIARTAPEGIVTVRTLIDMGVSVRILNMGLIEDTMVGRMMVTVMFAMAEFEHDLILERMAEGKAVARSQDGYREGRPRVEVDARDLEEMLTEVELGRVSKREAARRLGMSDATFRRRVKEMVA